MNAELAEIAKGEGETMALPVIEDADFLAKRIAELRLESTRALNCTCEKSDDGKTIHSEKCPEHGQAARAAQAANPNAAFLAPAQHIPEDDWQALKQAQCQGAAMIASFLGRSMVPVGEAHMPLRDRLAELGLALAPKRP